MKMKAKLTFCFCRCCTTIRQCVIGYNRKEVRTYGRLTHINEANRKQVRTVVRLMNIKESTVRKCALTDG